MGRGMPSTPSLALMIWPSTWTPQVCKIMAFWGVFSGFGVLFYILRGSRYSIHTISGTSKALTTWDLEREQRARSVEPRCEK